MLTHADDFRLLTKCINGDSEAWDIFVKRYAKLVYYAITKTMQSYSARLEQENIEDIFNSLFLSLLENDYKKLRQFEARNDCTLSSWVRLIAIRQTIDFLRKQRNYLSLDDDRKPMIEECLPDTQISVERRLEEKEQKRLVEEAVEDLPASDKLFLALYYEKGLPLERIADVMHVAVNTIYSKKKRIQEKIKKIIRDAA